MSIQITTVPAALGLSTCVSLQQHIKGSPAIQYLLYHFDTRETQQNIKGSPAIQYLLYNFDTRETNDLVWSTFWKSLNHL